MVAECQASIVNRENFFLIPTNTKKKIIDLIIVFVFYYFL